MPRPKDERPAHRADARTLSTPERTDLLWVEINQATPDVPWDAIRAARSASPLVFALELADVAEFLRTMPDDMRKPTPARSSSGLPKNVWVGGRLQVWRELLDVGAYRRFLIVDNETVPDQLETALGAWRCSSCGRRGEAPRPNQCPHAARLCGDAKLVPQIHWIIDRGAPEIYTKEIVHAAGAAYWPSEFPHV